VQNQLGGADGVLGDFGFQAPSRKAPDETTKAAAVAKRAATRAAAHDGQTSEGEGQGNSPGAGASGRETHVTRTRAAGASSNSRRPRRRSLWLPDCDPDRNLYPYRAKNEH
jgi:hypothetical protein